MLLDDGFYVVEISGLEFFIRVIKMSTELNNNADTTTIENVQDCVDKLLLNIFEAARGHSDPQSAPERSKQLIAVYKEAVESVDKLVGINKTKIQQEQYLSELSEQFTTLKTEVLMLEADLKTIIEKTDVELDGLLDYKSH